VFDVGFWELLFLFTLALVILGPDKLPAVVSTVGRWTGRARALARGLRLQIEREMAADQTVQRPPADKSSKPHPAAEQSSANAATAFDPGDASAAPDETTGQADAAQAAGTTPPQQPPPASDDPVTDVSGPSEPERRDER
jgi:sec-independent protein translocase protein TatB